MDALWVMRGTQKREGEGGCSAAAHQPPSGDLSELNQHKAVGAQ